MAAARGARTLSHCTWLVLLTMEAAGCSGLYIYSEDFGSSRRGQSKQDAGDVTIEDDDEDEPPPVNVVEPEPDPEPEPKDASVEPKDASVGTGTVEPSGLCSLESKTNADLSMHNTFTDRTVAIFWVDYDCVEKPYGTIAPGAKKSIGSFVTHPWRFRNSATNELYKEYIPTVGGAQDIFIP